MFTRVAEGGLMSCKNVGDVGHSRIVSFLEKVESIVAST